MNSLTCLSCLREINYIFKWGNQIKISKEERRGEGGSALFGIGGDFVGREVEEIWRDEVRLHLGFLF